MAIPSVFISYSHDSSNHTDRVLAFADRLRAEGVNAILDQYVKTNPPDEWTLWMDQHIQSSNFVLMVCTETYFRRVMGREKPGTGLGVRWEGKLIYNHIYNADTSDGKFIPVLADFHLEYARLFVASSEKDQAREHLAMAKRMIEEMGYRRREAECQRILEQING